MSSGRFGDLPVQRLISFGSKEVQAIGSKSFPFSCLSPLAAAPPVKAIIHGGQERLHVVKNALEFLPRQHGSRCVVLRLKYILLFFMLNSGSLPSGFIGLCCNSFRGEVLCNWHTWDKGFG